MPNWIRQHVGLTSVAAVLVVGGIVAATVAASASSSPQPAASGTSPTHTTVSQQHAAAPATLSISLTSAGFTIPGPNPRPAGPVTIRVTTPDKAGHYLYTAQLRGSTTVADVSQWSQEINGSNLPVHLRATHLLYKNVDYTGGVVVYPATPATFTINLKPGLYYFYDTPAYSDSDAAAVRLPGRSGLVQTMAAFSGPSHLNGLQVVASGSQPAAVKWPHVDGVIRLVMEHGQPRFQIPARLPRDGTFLVRSDINQPAQAVFRKVPAGYNNTELQSYFNAVMAGGATPANPLTSSPGGITSISPGNAIIVHLDFPAATYAVLSFLEDPSNGVHRAYEGLHQIVVLH